MRAGSEPDAVLRRLEITLHALLGRRQAVRWGRTLAGDGETVCLPREWLPFPAHLVRALHAARVGSGPLAASAGKSRGAWEELLASLQAEAWVRRHFEGLGKVYDALRPVTPGGGGAGQPGGSASGDRFLDLILGGEIAAGSTPPELGAAYRSWSAAWETWLSSHGGPVPLPPVPPPSGRLWYQATWRSLRERDEDRAVVEAPGGTPARRGLFQLAAADGRHFLVSVPARSESEAPIVGGVESLGTVSTDPARTAMSGSMEPTAWYDEWDAGRSGYLSHWCAVFEQPVADAPAAPRSSDAATPASVRRIRRAFERYRVSSRWNRREPDGQELDLEAVVEARAEAGGHRFATDRVFMSRVVPQADAAVAVVVDLSESVFGVTLEIEKTALLLLGAALEAVGDTFAFYGFRGRSRLRCELLRVKDFDEPYPAAVDRIAHLRSSGYTRIAPALRHVTVRLAATARRHRILLLVTDGMPFDTDGYGGAYAVEDTRRAWLEARARGVRPYCLDVDVTANQYLPRMCGPASWTVVSEARRLPDALLTLYERARL